MGRSWSSRRGWPTIRLMRQKRKLRSSKRNESIMITINTEKFPHGKGVQFTLTTNNGLDRWQFHCLAMRCREVGLLVEYDLKGKLLPGVDDPRNTLVIDVPTRYLKIMREHIDNANIGNDETNNAIDSALANLRGRGLL